MLVVGWEREVWVVAQVGGPPGPLVEGSGVVLGRPGRDRDGAVIGPVSGVLAPGVGWRGWLAEVADGHVAAEPLIQQAGVLPLGRGRVALQAGADRAELLAAGAAPMRRAHRGAQKQGDDKAERGGHRQQLALAVAADRLGEHGGLAGATTPPMLATRNRNTAIGNSRHPIT
jgi:hypothetical protein